MFCEGISQEDINFQKLISLKEFGVQYISYGLEISPGKLVYFFSNYSWGSDYFKNRFFLSDPLIKVGKLVQEHPIMWESVPIETKEQKNIMESRFGLCSIESGISFTRKRNNMFEVIAIGSKTDSSIILKNKFSLITSFCDDIYKNI